VATVGLGHHTAAPDSDQKNLGRNKETWDLGNAVGQQTAERQQWGWGIILQRHQKDQNLG